MKVEFTGGPLVISVPPDCTELTMKKAELLKNPAKEIQRAIDQPCGGPTIEEIIGGKGKEAGQLIVAITISDITRPVPYQGKKGILPPLLKKLLSLGVRRENIRYYRGNGNAPGQYSPGEIGDAG